jgi:hypothetical protein
MVILPVMVFQLVELPILVFELQPIMVFQLVKLSILVFELQSVMDIGPLDRLLYRQPD